MNQVFFLCGSLPAVRQVFLFSVELLYNFIFEVNYFDIRFPNRGNSVVKNILFSSNIYYQN